MTKYSQAKETLKFIAMASKKEFKNDKPAIRQAINDSADMLCKDLQLSEWDRHRLALYSCKLHPR